MTDDTKRVQAEALDEKAFAAAITAFRADAPADWPHSIAAAIRAYLATLPEAPAVPLGVKRLEWEEPTPQTNGCWTAKSPLGTYSVVNEGGWYASRDDVPRDFYFEWYGEDMSRDTLATAQAAAQADFEARIRSSLVATPPAPTAAVDGEEFEAAQFELNSALEFGDYARAERIQIIIDALRRAALAKVSQNGAVERHSYSPDYMAMGDCRICGHTADSPRHLPPYGPAALKAHLSPGTAEEGEPIAFMDEDGTVFVPKGSPIADLMKARPEPPIGRKLLPLYASPSPNDGEAKP